MPLIESGRRMPRLHTLILICSALDISPCQLLEGVGREVANSRAPSRPITGCQCPSTKRGGRSVRRPA
jgi:hypothetical protein